MKSFITNQKFNNGGAKNNHGITLIALVVTIIVLLILAGVSLNLIAGSNGILGRVTTAVNQTKQAADEERRELARAEALMHSSNETYTDKSGAKAIIPAGFAPTGIDGETEISGGLVITDPDGNEFVWIPVDGTNIKYEKKAGTNNWHMSAQGANDGGKQISQMVAGEIYGTTSILGTTVAASENDIVNTIPEAAVINAAKGFWVSRYEAGVDTGNKTGNDINATTLGAGADNVIGVSKWYDQEIVSKKGVQPVRFIYQQDALNIANSWNTNSSVQSGLITGAQWDTMCNFIGWSIANSDCRSWGNYVNTASANYDELWHSTPGVWNDWTKDTNSPIVKGKTVADASRWVFPTGTFITENGRNTAQKNIYDVAGNLWEWTTEIPINAEGGRHAVLRGGGAYNDGSDSLAADRNGNYSASGSRDWGFGFRFAIYVDIRTELMKAL